jgi:ARG/rhodanese/phosphatase superfamily protein
MEILQHTLSRLSYGCSGSALNLEVHGLMDPEARHAAEYLTLDQAMKEGQIEIGEVSEGGNVPELMVLNRSERPVLLLDGEELVGAKQNRVLNITVLVPEKTELRIPVSCVEQGRWSYRGRNFESKGRTLYAEGRAEKMMHVTASLRSTGARYANQSAVWNSVAKKAAGHDVQSSTGAMEDIYEQLDEQMKAYRSIPRPEGASGAIFCIDGKPVGIELFDCPAIFRGVFTKLVDSYAVDALDTRDPVSHTTRSRERDRLIKWVATAPGSRHKALGLGDDLRMESPRIVGGALEAEDRLVYLSAFARRPAPGPRRRPAGAQRDGARMQSASRRKDHKVH